MTFLSFDTETHLIEPGLLAPPVVCGQWALSERTFAMAHRDGGLRYEVETWLHSDHVLVGHNVAFDMAVLMAQWPELTVPIFQKYDRDQVTDTMLREQLIMIAAGRFRSYRDPVTGEGVVVKYSLTDCSKRHFGYHLKKEGWRLFYRAFDEHPDVSTWPAVAAQFQRELHAGRAPAWFQDYLARGILTAKDVADVLVAPPEEAVEYALKDGTTTLALCQSQERYAHLLKDQFRQARAAFALHLSSCWGVHTSGPEVQALKVKLTEEFGELQYSLQAAGLVREDGTADTKAAMAMMERACAEEGLEPFVTAGGKVSLSAESCDRFDGDNQGDAADTIAEYSRFQTLRKTLANDIKMLEAGVYVPLQPRYDLADTGRTRASKPNIQAINRGAGIRECIRPRPGYLFAQADYEGLELHTFAVWCEEHGIPSELGKRLNAGQDAHAAMAAVMMGITYEEAIRRKKAGDKDFKDKRRAAKAVNFGLQGCLGAKKLVKYAKANYGVVMSEAEAQGYRAAWQQATPECVPFFRSAAEATVNGQAGYEEHAFVGRFRGGLRYSALCNGRFQGLGADAAKEALWRVTRAMYAEPASPLFGCRVVAFVHDEILAEVPEDVDKADRAARELARIMIEGANMYLSKVPVRLEPTLCDRWTKAVEPCYDANGRLIPWRPKET